jgi:hypothetical protein
MNLNDEMPSQEEAQYEPVDTGESVDYQAEAQRLRAEVAETKQRYKSLQGQFDSVQRNQTEMQMIRAQMQDMQAALIQKNQDAVQDEPLIDGDFHEFLADHSPSLEKSIRRGMGSVEKSLSAKIAALESQLLSVSNDVSQSSFKTIRATDPIASSDEYTNYLKTTKDTYGRSLYDGIVSIGQISGQDEGIKAFMSFKNDFIATGKSPAQLTTSPKIQSNGGAIQPAQRTASKQDIDKLNAEYASLVKSNLKQDLPRRLALVVKIAQLQSKP